MSIKLVLQIIIFLFTFTGSIGRIFDNDGLSKEKIYILINFIVIIAYIFNF